MKILMFMFLSTSVYAANYFPIGKDGAKTTYMNKLACEQAEGQDCFEITDKNAAIHKVLPNGDVVIDVGKKNAFEAAELAKENAAKNRKDKVTECVVTLQKTVVSLVEIRDCLLDVIKEQRGL